MTNKLLCTLVLALFSWGAFAGTAPTWSSDVQCIVYSHCSSCHNPNGIAPFSLLTYADAYLNRYSMQADVSIKKMPPYLPNTNYQHYADMRTLSDQEISTIVTWVDSGGQQGDTAQGLPAPTFTGGPFLTHPDITARIPTFTVPYSTSDLYQCFVLTGAQDTAKYIKTIEVIPGNPSAVHHVLVFEDTAYTAVTLDSLAAGPGYANFGGTGSKTSKLIGAWVPGAGIDSMPGGMGIKLQKGARIIIQVHYPVTSVGKTDSTRVNIQFTDQQGLRNVSVTPVLNYLLDMTDGPIDIPQDSIVTYHEKFTTPVAVTVLSIAPHAHLVCTYMKSFAVTPAGDTIPLIEIPHWDFHWQGSHSFQRPIEVPAGSSIYGVATYDNTYNNPDGPRPITTVTAGEATSDEMMLFYFWYLPTVAGDDQIIIDTASHQPHYLGCVSTYKSDSVAAPNGIIQTAAAHSIEIYPNPAMSVLHYESDAEIGAISIMDIAGHLVRSQTVSGRSGQIAVGDMSSGIYFIKLETADGAVQTLRFSKE